MSFTRRGVLATVALAQSNLLGGCFGGSGDGGDGGGQSGGGGGGADTPTATPPPTTEATDTPTATATPVANADLTAATTTLLSEFEWFRTEYDPIIQQFPAVANGVLSAIDEMSPSDGLAPADADSLETATTAVADYVTENLVDHFEVAPALKTGDNVYVRDLRRAIDREDVDDQESVLGRTRLFYGNVGSREYISNEFSRRPVYDTLYDLLIPDGSSEAIVALASVDGEYVTWAHPDRTETTGDDGVDQHTHEFPSGHRVFTHAHDYSSTHQIRDHTNEPESGSLYAYGDGSVALLEDTETWRARMDDYEPLLTDVFAPVRSSDRSLGVYGFVAPISDGFDSTPLYLERFASPDAAVTAAEAAGGVDGTTRFADREWKRVFYEHQGTTLYAYRIRAGPTLVTVAPSPIVWERRPDWSAGLTATWLGAQPSD